MVLGRDRLVDLLLLLEASEAGIDLALGIWLGLLFGRRRCSNGTVGIGDGTVEVVVVLEGASPGGL